MKIFKVKKTATQIEIILFGRKKIINLNAKKHVLENYEKKLQQLKDKFGKEKIRVGFLINDPAKWQYQSLYEDLAKSDYFEPLVLVTELVTYHKGKKRFYKDIETCYDFFKSRNFNVEYAYDKKKYIPIDFFNIDILFYEQPWELSDIQSPLSVSKTALTCYCPYGLHLVEFYGTYMSDFHNLLWAMFVENDEVVERFSKIFGADNLFATGYPKLDAYFSTESHEINDGHKKMIIYAPHHSFEEKGLNCATFAFNGQEILELAKKYKDKIDWVFKPHPRFKSAVVLNKIMTEEEIDDYYQQWSDVGEIYDSGNYIDLFKQSDGLITDCLSFLGEYLPSKNPVFHLLGEKRPFNFLAKMFIDAYYKIEKDVLLEDIFREVIIEQNDFKKEERCSKIKIVLSEEKCSMKIIKLIEDKMK